MSDSSSSPATVAITFGEPEHGWLPVTFQAGDFHLDFFASDVPVNPLELLCDALATISVGGSARVMWHLEPAVYWFVFEKSTQEVHFEILEAARHDKLGTCMLQLTGSVRDILLPFYKALVEFATHNFREKHWPTLPKGSIKNLRQLLRDQH